MVQPTRNDSSGGNDTSDGGSLAAYAQRPRDVRTSDLDTTNLASSLNVESGPSHNPSGREEAGQIARSKLETNLIMLSLCLALFLAALDVTVITVAIPTIAEEMRSSAGYVWIGSAFLLADAATAPLWGKLADIWGRKPILLSAAVVFWTGSLVAALSVNMAMLIAGRALQGVGAGGIIVMVYVVISDLFSMRDRGFLLSIMSMVWAVAGGLGPIVGGAFTARISWRWCFYINLPISGVSIVLLFFLLKLHNPKTPLREGLAAIDWLGSLTITGGTLMLLFGLEFGGVAYPWQSATVICLLVSGVLVIALFTLVEARHAKYPIMPIHIFKRRSSMAALACSFFHGMAYISASYYLPLYFQGVVGASPLLSGVYILPLTLSLAVTAAVAGAVMKRTGTYLPVVIGSMGFMVLGQGLFIDLGAKANWAKIIIYQIIAGIGIGPNFQAPLVALQNTVDQRDVSSATSTFQFLRQLSTAVAVVVGNVVFQNRMQSQLPALSKALGPELADKFSGHNAAASVGLVASLTDDQRYITRLAYWDALMYMFVMYVAFAGCGLVSSTLIAPRALSREFEEHKTGLQSLQNAKATRTVRQS